MLQHILLDLRQTSDARTARMCARLHLREGKRQLHKGSSVKGIAALYDSLIFAMYYYVSKHQLCAAFVKGIDDGDVTGLFYALVRAGVFDDPLAFNRLSLMVERALWQKADGMDVDALLALVETLLRKLDVMPFYVHSH